MHLRTILFVLGVVGGILIGFTSLIASEIAMCATVLTILQLCIYLWKRKSDEGVALSLCTGLVAFGLVIGIVRVQFVEEKETVVCDSACTVEGVIARTPERSDTYQTIILDVEKKTMYDVQLRVPLYPVFQIGERIEVSGKITVPKKIYPHDGENSFDYLTYLHVHDVGSEMMFPKIETIDSEAHTLSHILGRWKESFMKRVSLYVSFPSSTLGSGMLFGDSSMPKETKDTFRIAGLSHIVVLSGFNIAIVIAFVLFIFTFMPLVLRIGLSFLFVIMFVIMVGGEASVVRATLMSFIGLLAMLVGREYVAKQALVISFALIILYAPIHLLHDVSLHLSFLATAGIVYLSSVIKEWVERFTPRFLLELVVTTCAAYIATLPYISYTFGTLSLYALVANVLALPLVPLGMLFTFMTIIGSFISITLATLVGHITTCILTVIIKIGESIAWLPHASISYSLSYMQMLALYVTMWVGYMVIVSRVKNETIPTYTEQGYLTDTISY